MYARTIVCFRRTRSFECCHGCSLSMVAIEWNVCGRELKRDGWGLNVWDDGMQGTDQKLAPQRQGSHFP